MEFAHHILTCPQPPCTATARRCYHGFIPETMCMGLSTTHVVSILIWGNSFHTFVSHKIANGAISCFANAKIAVQIVSDVIWGLEFQRVRCWQWNVIGKMPSVHSRVRLFSTGAQSFCVSDCVICTFWKPPHSDHQSANCGLSILEYQQ